jgi:DnaJ-class molecular chaperone
MAKQTPAQPRQCPECYGHGYIIVHNHATGKVYEEMCDSCHGTGQK